MSGRFKTKDRHGKPLTCKFCHAETWYDCLAARWYDVGGKSLHVDNCERRKAHYHNEAMERHEKRRQGGAG